MSSEEYESNVKLWEAVKTTDPKHQKPVEYGKRKFTAVDPQWQLQQATKLWGPYGERWGLCDLKHEIVRMDGFSTEGPYIEYAIILSAKFFYPSSSGEEVSFEIMNDDKFVRGQETLKKLVTNTRSKALSWLGFSADVFMGMYDDIEYVKDLKERSRQVDAMRDKMIDAVKGSKTALELEKNKVKIDNAIKANKLSDPEAIKEVWDEVAMKEASLLFQ